MPFAGPGGVITTDESVVVFAGTAVVGTVAENALGIVVVPVVMICTGLLGTMMFASAMQEYYQPDRKPVSGTSPLSIKVCLSPL